MENKPFDLKTLNKRHARQNEAAPIKLLGAYFCFTAYRWACKLDVETLWHFQQLHVAGVEQLRQRAGVHWKPPTSVHAAHKVICLKKAWTCAQSVLA